MRFRIYQAIGLNSKNFSDEEDKVSEKVKVKLCF